MHTRNLSGFFEELIETKCPPTPITKCSRQTRISSKDMLGTTKDMLRVHPSFVKNSTV